VPYAVLMAPDPDLTEEFLAACIEHRLVLPSDETRLKFVKNDFKYSYKSLPEMHCIYIPDLSTYRDVRDGPDWRTYEKKRTWWGDSNELDRLNKRPDQLDPDPPDRYIACSTKTTIIRLD
jgi:hypothetical protein